MKRTRIDTRIKILQERYKPKVIYELPEFENGIDRFCYVMDILKEHSEKYPDDSPNYYNCNIPDLFKYSFDNICDGDTEEIPI